MERQQINESIDACRPASDDLSLPELEQLAQHLRQDDQVRQQYERSQQCDLAIGQAFRDVPVPEGLSSKLLDAIFAGASEPVTPRDPVVAPVEANSLGQRGRARWKSMVWTMAALAASLLVVAFFANRNRGPEPNEMFANEVLQWTDTVIAAKWSRDFSNESLQRFPLDSSIRTTPRQWIRHSSRYDDQAVVYDLAQPGQRRALLFCVRTTNGNAFPRMAPAEPFSTTGGYAVAAWQSDALLYVLAVEGDSRRYRQFVTPPSRLARIDWQTLQSLQSANSNTIPTKSRQSL